MYLPSLSLWGEEQVGYSCDNFVKGVVRHVKYVTEDVVQNMLKEE